MNKPSKKEINGKVFEIVFNGAGEGMRNRRRTYKINGKRVASEIYFNQFSIAHCK